MKSNFARLAFLPLLALASATQLSAQDKPAPLAAVAKDVNIPHQTMTLKNGLRVIVNTDRKAPVVAVAVWYYVGSRNEPKGKTGFAHLFEHLMFNGSENLPGDFFVPLREVGATDFNGTTNPDRTNYFQTVPTGALEFTLFAEADRMGRLLGGVTQAKLDNQRGVVQNEKRQGDNSPYGLTRYIIPETLFPVGHPYHHSTIGSMADLDAASLDDVKAWFRQNYGPNNAVLVLSGDIDLKTAKPMIERQFGSFPAGPKVVQPKITIPTLPAPVRKVMKDKVASTRIYKLWSLPGMLHKDAVPLEVAGSVLGGLSSSRLDTALVRNEKLAASVGASASMQQGAGSFFVFADVMPGVDPKKLEARLDALIADFVKSGPSADEIQRVNMVTASGQLSGLDSSGGFGGKAVTLARGATFANDPNFFKKELNALAKVTPGQVQKSMQSWLTRPVFTLIVEPGERDGSYAEAKSAPPAKPAASEPERAPNKAMWPAIGALKSLDFPNVERAKLSNGMEVYFAKTSGIPKVQMSVNFNAGYAADPASGLGTHALMLNAMEEGTKTRNSVQIAEETERLGMSLSYGASLDRTSIGMSALKVNLGLSLDLLTDVLRNPAFADGEVARVRDQQINRIAQELSQPAGLVGRVMPAVLYGAEHPYGRSASGLGQKDIVKGLGPDQLRAFHAKWIRPDNARVFIAGDTTLAAVMPLLEKSLGNWKSDGSAKPEKAFNVATPRTTPRIILVDRPNSPQSLIAAGHIVDQLTGRDDLVTLRAANENIGGNFLSRLNMDLRETKGWSYGVRSSIGANEEMVSFNVAAPVQADKTGDSLKAIVSNIKDVLSTRGFTPTELQQTINGNARSLPGRFEGTGAILGGVADIVTYNRPDTYYETLATRYQALTAAEMDAAARKHIDPSKLVFVIVGDAAKVKPQLDGLGMPLEVMPMSAIK